MYSKDMEGVGVAHVISFHGKFPRWGDASIK